MIKPGLENQAAGGRNRSGTCHFLPRLHLLLLPHNPEIPSPQIRAHFANCSNNPPA